MKHALVVQAVLIGAVLWTLLVGGFLLYLKLKRPPAPRPTEKRSEALRKRFTEKRLRLRQKKHPH